MGVLFPCVNSMQTVIFDNVHIPMQSTVAVGSAFVKSHAMSFVTNGSCAGESTS